MYDSSKPILIVIDVESGVVSVNDELSNIPDDVIVDIQDHDDVFCPICNNNIGSEFNAEAGKYEPRPCEYCTESQ